MLRQRSRHSVVYYRAATAHSILSYGKRGNAAYSVSYLKDRTSMINRMYQSSIQLELVSLNGYFGRVGQFQRLYRSSWSVSTAISVELVSFNGYIGRVGQFQRLYRSSWSALTDTSCVRPITRSIDRAGGGKNEQSYTTQIILCFIYLPAAPRAIRNASG